MRVITFVILWLMAIALTSCGGSGCTAPNPETNQTTRPKSTKPSTRKNKENKPGKWDDFTPEEVKDAFKKEFSENPPKNDEEAEREDVQIDKESEDQTQSEALNNLGSSIYGKSEQEKKEIFNSEGVLLGLFRSPAKGEHREKGVFERGEGVYLLHMQNEAAQYASKEELEKVIKPENIEFAVKKNSRTARSFVNSLAKKGIDIEALSGNDPKVAEILREARVEEVMKDPDKAKRNEDIKNLSKEEKEAGLNVAMDSISYDKEMQDALRAIIDSGATKEEKEELIKRAIEFAFSRPTGTSAKRSAASIKRNRLITLNRLGLLAPALIPQNNLIEYVDFTKKQIFFDAFERDYSFEENKMVGKSEEEIKKFVTENIRTKKEEKMFIDFVAEDPSFGNSATAFKLYLERPDQVARREEIINNLVRSSTAYESPSSVIYRANKLGITRADLKSKIFGPGKNQTIEEYALAAMKERYPDIATVPKQKSEFIRYMGDTMNALAEQLNEAHAQGYKPEHIDREAFEREMDPDFKTSVENILGVDTPDSIRALGLTDAFDIVIDISSLFRDGSANQGAYAVRMKKVHDNFLSLTKDDRIGLFVITTDNAEFWSFGYDQLQRLLLMPLVPASVEIVRLALDAQKSNRSGSIGRMISVSGRLTAVGNQKRISAEEWVNSPVYNTSVSPLHIVLSRERKKIPNVGDEADAQRSLVDTLLFFGADPFNNAFADIFTDPRYQSVYGMIDIFVKNFAHRPQALKALSEKLHQAHFISEESALYQESWLNGAVAGYSKEALQMLHEGNKSALLLNKASQHIETSFTSFIDDMVKSGDKGQKLTEQRGQEFFTLLFGELKKEHLKKALESVLKISSKKLKNHPDRQDKIEAAVKIFVQALESRVKGQWNEYATPELIKEFESGLNIDEATAKIILEVH
jgi:hypothetical protein